jgi:hypothetical protein
MTTHVNYEVYMLGKTAQMLTIPISAAGPLHDAVLESFSFHARVLLDFFFSEHPRDDDLVAGDYFDDPSRWVAARGELPIELVQVKDRVGKEVAHLTLGRLRVEDKRWHFLAIARALSEVFERYTGAIDRDLLSPDLRQSDVSEED